MEAGLIVRRYKGRGRTRQRGIPKRPGLDLPSVHGVVRKGAAGPALAGAAGSTLMAPKEIVLDTATGSRLSRHWLTRPGEIGSRGFTTLRKARPAFRAQVAEASYGVPAGTPGA